MEDPLKQPAFLSASSRLFDTQQRIFLTGRCHTVRAKLSTCQGQDHESACVAIEMRTIHNLLKILSSCYRRRRRVPHTLRVRNAIHTSSSKSRPVLRVLRRLSLFRERSRGDLSIMRIIRSSFQCQAAAMNGRPPNPKGAKSE
jgi:hypothetical protein